MELINILNFRESEAEPRGVRSIVWRNHSKDWLLDRSRLRVGFPPRWQSKDFQVLI